MNEPLNELLNRARTHMKESASGPYFAADIVHRVHENWDNQYSHESDIKSMSKLCTHIFGRKRGLGYFNLRRLAVAKLGETVRRILHHDAACWAANKIAESNVREFMLLCGKAFSAKYKNPLSKGQVTELAHQGGFYLKGRMKRECTGCMIAKSRIVELELLLGMSQAAE